MKRQERYELKAEKALLVFEFISTGPRGDIAKLVQYSETNLKDFDNLGFGDKNAQTGEIDDRVISNNGDSQKVLASVAATVYAGQIPRCLDLCDGQHESAHAALSHRDHE